MTTNTQAGDEELNHIEDMIVAYGRLPTQSNRKRIMQLIKSKQLEAEQARDTKWIEAFQAQCHVNTDGWCKYFKYSEEDGPEDMLSKFFPERLLDSVRAELQAQAKETEGDS